MTLLERLLQVLVSWALVRLTSAESISLVRVPRQTQTSSTILSVSNNVSVSDSDG